MDTTGKIKRKKNETTLREAVVGSVERFYELHGLEVAIQKFDEMKVLFSGSRDWPDIDKEVTAFFLEKKRQAQEAAGEREQKINQAWADALSKGVVTNQFNLMPGNNPQAPYYSSSTQEHQA